MWVKFFTGDYINVIPVTSDDRVHRCVQLCSHVVARRVRVRHSVPGRAVHLTPVCFRDVSGPSFLTSRAAAVKHPLSFGHVSFPEALWAAFPLEGGGGGGRSPGVSGVTLGSLKSVRV